MRHDGRHVKIQEDQSRDFLYLSYEHQTTGEEKKWQNHKIMLTQTLTLSGNQTTEEK